jgi:predicted SAM-dependent methyltransferase
VIGHLKKIIPESFCNRYRSRWQRTIRGINPILVTLRRHLFPPPFPHLEVGTTNIHLGCGPVNHPKFINIDAITAPHIHYVRQIDDLSIFKDSTVDLIYASHCLEHFSHRKIAQVLEEWYRVLKSGGILRLSVPDFDLLLDIYNDSGKDINGIINFLMGGQNYEYNFHKTVFTKPSLCSILKSVGFHEMREWMPHSSELTFFNDSSNLKIVMNEKSYPISLNIEAIK